MVNYIIVKHWLGIDFQKYYTKGTNRGWNIFQKTWLLRSSTVLKAFIIALALVSCRMIILEKHKLWYLGFSQTHKIGNIGITTNFVFPFTIYFCFCTTWCTDSVRLEFNPLLRHRFFSIQWNPLLHLTASNRIYQPIVCLVKSMRAHFPQKRVNVTLTFRCPQWSGGYDAHLNSERLGFGPPLRYKLFCLSESTVVLQNVLT